MGSSVDVLIRVDSSDDIGIGHVVRCRALSEALQNLGLQVAFASQALTKNCRAVLERDNPVFLEPQPTHIGRLSLEDARWTADLARNIGVRMLIIDQYGAGDDFLDYVCRGRYKVGLIDDVGGRSVGGLDLLLNPRPVSPGEYSGKEESLCALFGPRYALLRGQFRRERLRRPRRADRSHRSSKLLVTMGGGSAAADRCAEILGQLEAVSNPSRIVCAVTGLTERLREYSLNSRHDIEIVSGRSDLSQLMASSDLSVTAGGSSAWEMCCTGLPMVVLPGSKDQELIASFLVQRGCAIRTSMGSVASTVDFALSSADILKRMACHGVRTVDGRGASRVADLLKGRL